jgi:predicted ferric reductase
MENVMNAVSRLRLIFIAIILVVAASWLISIPAEALTSGFWRLRSSIVYFTGILAIGSMSIAVILASRPVQIESILGGLDKFYRLHKWLGIAGAIFAILHWLAENAPRWAVQQGWLEPRPRSTTPRAAAATGLDPFRDWRGIAEDIGEWGFYVLLVLVALALWKRVPYRAFFQAHRLLSATYLALIFHSVILMDRSYWSEPVGWLLAALMGLGAAAAFISLFRRIGADRKAAGVIETLHYHEANGVLDVGIRLSTAWPGHDVGQFAFVNFGGPEGAHPFTITSAWQRDGRLSFSIKGLGDYTKTLPKRLFAGQNVTIEGPYGRFNFKSGRERQIWIGGGMGISPFIAGLHGLANRQIAGQVDLIYTTRAPAEAFIDNIRQLAEQAGVRFHLMVEQQSGRLTLDRLEEMVPDWKEADIWFSGPVRFGDAIRDAAVARGFPLDRFHQELFEMR